MQALPDTPDEPLLAGTLAGRSWPPAAFPTLPRPSARTRFSVIEANALLREKMAPWLQDLRLTVDSCSSFGATLRLPANARILRPGDTLCGPALMACADTAMAIAIMGRLGQLRNVATVTLSIDFMRATLPGDVAIHATVRTQGRSLIFTECSFVNPRDREVSAHATATWALLPALATDRDEWS
jgi:uncharacterized protein (TIGR00369 family)